MYCCGQPALEQNWLDCHSFNWGLTGGRSSTGSNERRDMPSVGPLWWCWSSVRKLTLLSLVKVLWWKKGRLCIWKVGTKVDATGRAQTLGLLRRNYSSSWIWLTKQSSLSSTVAWNFHPCQLSCHSFCLKGPQISWYTHPQIQHISGISSSPELTVELSFIEDRVFTLVNQLLLWIWP